MCLGAGTDLQEYPTRGGWHCESPWYASEVRYIWRSTSMLSLSASVCSSAVLEGSPHTCCSLRPLTGLGALGLGNHLRMLQVRQFGPPPMKRRRPAAAREHRWFHRGGCSISWPRGPLSRRMSTAQIKARGLDTWSGCRMPRSASSLPAEQDLRPVKAPAQSVRDVGEGRLHLGSVCLGPGQVPTLPWATCWVLMGWPQWASVLGRRPGFGAAAGCTLWG